MDGNMVKDITTNFEKLDKFKGYDFRRWQKKMHFLLTTLNVFYVLTTPMPELLEDATMKALQIRAKWKNDDYICRGHILKGRSDSLFDVYTNVESAKELWDSLESKYMAEDSSSKKFLDFKHTLKHGKDDMSLVKLGSHLRIEESLRAQDSDKGKGKEVGGPSVNMTEEGVPTRNQSWNVGSVVRLVTSKGIAEVVKRTTQMLVVRERGLRTNPKTKVDAIVWWIDFGATTHICKDRCWFKTYEPVEDESVLYMGDDHFAHVHGKGSNLEIAQLYYRVPIKRNNTTPYELWYKKRPNLAFLGVWGCRAVVRLPDPKRKTLGEKFPEPRKGKRVRKAKSYGSDFQLYLVERSRDQVGLQYSYCYSIEEDSRTYNEAMQSRDFAFWKEAIDDEIGSNVVLEGN
nr:hypothetical protein [Tanacetum cinerariifolium]